MFVLLIAVPKFDAPAVYSFVMSSKEKCNILIGCTGSVASVKLPMLVKLLRDLKVAGYETDIKVIATKNSFHFFSAEELRSVVTIFSDEDEWSAWKEMSDPVLHIELRRWADLLLIAPMDANTLAKVANGLCDNLLTCTVRAWDRHKPLMFCPAMNTYMWDHPITATHVKQLKDLGYIEIPCVAKRLACGEIGYGGMAEVSTIVCEVSKVLNSCLCAKRLR